MNLLLLTIHWHDIVGTVGVITLLSTYLMLQLNYLSAKSLRYSILNGVGALLILVSLSHNFNFPAFVIEMCWFVISCIGAVVSLIDMRKAARQETP